MNIILWPVKLTALLTIAMWRFKSYLHASCSTKEIYKDSMFYMSEEQQSRARDQHCSKSNCQCKKTFDASREHFSYNLRRPKKDFFTTTLCIKYSMKQFVKHVPDDGDCFKYL